MSKINKRNFVKKNMDKLHKPKTEDSGKIYNRKNFDNYKEEDVAADIYMEDNWEDEGGSIK